MCTEDTERLRMNCCVPGQRSNQPVWSAAWFQAKCLRSHLRSFLTLTAFPGSGFIPVFRGNFELTNGYENCRQLGSDRWFAAIGAASLYPGQPLLVVHMGTATTVDSVVSENGRLVFCGGRILPGPAMMYESLVKGTRCRPNGIGAVEPFPKNTDSAISTGILEAHLGVIEHARAAMQDKGSDVKIVFAGGAAPLLAPYIRARFPQAVLKHNLVLRGLAQQASQQGLTA